jgi:predicted ATP-dependent endonuclease of OLD family
LEDGQEYVLMMDEPEISMHISWQYKLIDMILQLNPNVQIILTTHSPMIFSDGWGDKAIYMENITTNTRK